MLEVILEDLKNQKEVRKNLIQMKELLKDEETRKELSELSADNSIFLGFLKEEDPKVRKNAALILGMTGDQEILPALMEAYENEETLFVKSDYVKAMQKLDCTDYLTPLKLRLEELQKMQKSLTGRDRNLRRWTASLLAKLAEMTDAEYEALDLYPDE